MTSVLYSRYSTRDDQYSNLRAIGKIVENRIPETKHRPKLNIYNAQYYLYYYYKTTDWKHFLVRVIRLVRTMGTRIYIYACIMYIHVIVFSKIHNGTWFILQLKRWTDKSRLSPGYSWTNPPAKECVAGRRSTRLTLYRYTRFSTCPGFVEPPLRSPPISSLTISPLNKFVIFQSRTYVRLYCVRLRVRGQHLLLLRNILCS